MRAVFQTQPEVAHVYLGSKRHLMERIFNDANEPFWRSAKHIELGPIDAGRLRAVHRRPVRGDRPGDRARGGRARCSRARAATRTRRRSSLLRLGGVGRRRPGDARAGRAGAGRAARSEHAHFARVWDGSTATERILLAALAREPGRVFSGDYRRRHGLPAATNVQRSVSSLVRRELVGKDAEGRYEIIEPFLADWIRRLGV